MRKIINKKGRVFGIISIIDVFVLAVVAVLVVAVFTKTGSNNAPTSTVNTVPVTYKIFINIVRDTAASLLREGDDLYTDSGTYIGEITDVEVTDARMLTYTIDGTYVLGSVEERYDVMLTVSAQCSVSGGRYYADRTYELTANTDQKLCTKYNAFNGVIMDIKEADNG